MTINFPNLIEIGRDVYIATGCWLHASAGIVIEDEVMLAPYVVVICGDHTLHEGSYRFGPPRRAPIRIVRGAWLAAHTTVLKGVTIGRGALLASNAVATKSIPDFCVAGGVPARVIKADARDPEPSA